MRSMIVPLFALAAFAMLLVAGCARQAPATPASTPPVGSPPASSAGQDTTGAAIAQDVSDQLSTQLDQLNASMPSDDLGVAPEDLDLGLQ